MGYRRSGFLCLSSSLANNEPPLYVAHITPKLCMRKRETHKLAQDNTCIVIHVLAISSTIE